MATVKNLVDDRPVKDLYSLSRDEAVVTKVDRTAARIDGTR